MRNCTRDEGGPFEVGNQVLISSHRTPLMRVAEEVTKQEQKIEIKKPKERTGVSSDSQSAFMVALFAGDGVSAKIEL